MKALFLLDKEEVRELVREVIRDLIGGKPFTPKTERPTPLPLKYSEDDLVGTKKRRRWRRPVTPEKRRAILNFAERHGIIAAVTRYEIHPSTIYTWRANMRFKKISTHSNKGKRLKSEFSDTEISEILEYAEEHSTEETAKKFNLHSSAIYRWRSERAEEDTRAREKEASEDALRAHAREVRESISVTDQGGER